MSEHDLPLDEIFTGNTASQSLRTPTVEGLTLRIDAMFDAITGSQETPTASMDGLQTLLSKKRKAIMQPFLRGELIETCAFRTVGACTTDADEVVALKQFIRDTFAMAFYPNSQLITHLDSITVSYTASLSDDEDSKNYMTAGYIIVIDWSTPLQRTPLEPSA